MDEQNATLTEKNSRSASTPRITDSHVAVFSLILTPVLAFTGYYLDGYVQAIVFIVLGAPINVLIIEARRRVTGVSLPSSLLWIKRTLYVVALSLALLLALLQLRAQLPVRFPREDGLIAGFATGEGGPARTAMGTHFSILSDSAWNSDSKCWYKRLSDTADEPSAFLRINYQLLPRSDFEPYVGVHADFSLPPATPYDISHYRQLSLTVRLGQPLRQSPIDVAVVLYSSNVRNPQYAFPTCYLPAQDLTAEWITVKLLFSDFRPPRWVDYPTQLDLKHVYRVAFLILGAPDHETFGHLDLADIRLEK